MFSQKEMKSLRRAFESRDARFDGHFYTGVKTTGIYCRPVCPAKPKLQNVEFYKTIYDAEKAGYRPCLRCRPESSPFSPAWLGKSATIQRAVKLISEGFLNRNSQEKLAQTLGVTSRHLRRLFNSEVHVSPKEMGDIERLNFSRTLIIETKLSMTEIAFSSGFKSIRRFNDAFKKRFHTSPSSLRSKKQNKLSSGEVKLFLPYRPPYHWLILLNSMRHHETPYLESIDESSYSRVIETQKKNKTAWLKVTNDHANNRLCIELNQVPVGDLFSLVQKIKRMFDLDSNPEIIAKPFLKSSYLKQIYKKTPGIRLPRGWDGFETSISTILGQFVSINHAKGLIKKLIESYGEESIHPNTHEKIFLFPKPETLMKASLSELKITTVRKEAIRAFSKLVHEGQLNIHKHQDIARFKKDLLSVKGIGPWTAEYICLRAVGDADSFPDKDLFIGRILKAHPRIKADDFRPWRSYLTLYLWRASDSLLKKEG